MRALLPKFTDRCLRGGPFILVLTDLHQSNIFVDDDWHITRIIDLGWVCARPIEMLSPPYWLSSRGLDELVDHLDEYGEIYKEFVNILEAEELAGYQSNACAQLVRSFWKSGVFWYCQALDYPSALYALFIDHIQPRFAKLSNTALDEFSRVVMPYWDVGTPKFISSKIEEQEQYSTRVREAFAATSPILLDKEGEDRKEGSS